MNGELGEAAEEANAFADKLRPLLTCPIQMWDERLTTTAANRALRDAGQKTNAPHARHRRPGRRANDFARLPRQRGRFASMGTRLKLVVAYDGAPFAGWQSQKNGRRCRIIWSALSPP